jgi:hypothetical protein
MAEINLLGDQHQSVKLKEGRDFYLPIKQNSLMLQFNRTKDKITIRNRLVHPVKIEQQDMVDCTLQHDEMVTVEGTSKIFYEKVDGVWDVNKFVSILYPKTPPQSPNYSPRPSPPSSPPLSKRKYVAQQEEEKSDRDVNAFLRQVKSKHGAHISEEKEED